MTRMIPIDVTFSNVTKRTSGAYREKYGCDAVFTSAAPEIQTDGTATLSGVEEDVQLVFNLKTTSFPMNKKSYNCGFPAAHNTSFWIARKTAPPPQANDAPPFKGNGKLDGQFDVETRSTDREAILNDANNDGQEYEYCLIVDFQLGGATKSIVIDPVIINRKPGADI